MAKKRTSLDTLISPTDTGGVRRSAKASPIEKSAKKRREKKGQGEQLNKTGIVKQSVYLPAPVHEQLRRLAFEENNKMHDYLMEGLDLVFRARGLKSIDELIHRII
jgi:hypothetical protein